VKSENLGITSKLPKEKRECNKFMCNKLMINKICSGIKVKT
jgi:hypothetical protein